MSCYIKWSEKKNQFHHDVKAVGRKFTLEMYNDLPSKLLIRGNLSYNSIFNISLTRIIYSSYSKPPFSIPHHLIIIDPL